MNRQIKNHECNSYSMQEMLVLNHRSFSCPSYLKMVNPFTKREKTKTVINTCEHMGILPR
jgi:hypothetical protein